MVLYLLKIINDVVFTQIQSIGVFIYSNSINDEAFLATQIQSIMFVFILKFNQYVYGEVDIL